MKHYCHYHPTSAAKWYCDTCQIYYDNACTPDANKKTKSGLCPKCQHSLHFIEKQSDFRPFWQVMPRFFRMPFSIEALWVSAIALMLSSLYYLHTMATILIPLVIIALISHYGRLISQSFVDGKQGSPALSAFLSFTKIKENTGLTLILSLSLLGPMWLGQVVGLIPALCIAMILLTALPGIILLLLSNHAMVEETLLFLRKMGWSYLGLAGYVITAYVFCLILSDFALQHLPTLFFPVITSLSFSYFSIAFFGMLSFVLHQQIPTTTELNANSSPNLYNENANIIRLEADMDMALKRGEFLEVASLLEKELKRDNSSDLRRDQLYRILMAKKEYEGLERYAQFFLSLMLVRGKVKDAVNFIELLRKQNPEFKLYDLELSLSLAESFQKNEHYKLILWLANEAHTRFDPSPDLVKLYLLTAKTILAKFDDKKNARHYLDYITNHYADDPISEPAKILQRHIFKTHYTPLKE